ncbi:MAG: hypothetical protein FJ398_17150 [Verrucomicrobia bacterium]|nr:hypothetical protein [Verrucomicrobiota bacterium]
MTPTQKQPEAFHAPLKPSDTAEQTVGCRHTQPNICAKHSMPKVCAFVRADGMCFAPPTSWKKQFLKLKTGAAKKK